MKPTSILALLALLFGLIASACGADDEEETGSTATKAEFIAAADQICGDADQALADEALEQYPEGPPVGRDAASFAEEVVIPNLEGVHGAIAALTPPEGEEEAVADILEKLQAGIDELTDDPAGFVESEALADASAAATDFGLTECGA